MDALEVPRELEACWRRCRTERALIRKRIYDECSKFWKVFPRLRRRVMPAVYYSDLPSWFEPEPLEGLGWDDRLGLKLRWRLSGVMPDGTVQNGRPKLKAVWEYDWPRDNPPSIGNLIAGKIVDPGDQENYRYFWRMLHDWHDHYLRLGESFTQIVKLSCDANARLATLVASHGELSQIQMSADGTSWPSGDITRTPT